MRSEREQDFLGGNKMKNWKHSLSAFMAVVMVGSLASIQVKDMSAALANKNNEEISIEIPDEEKREIVRKVSEIDKEDSQKIKETVDEITDLHKVEVVKPYEPKAGFVIATTSSLNVRAEKSADSEIIAQLTPGSELWLEGEYEDWYMISVNIDGTEQNGYVSKEFVTSSYEEAKNILLDGVMYEKATAYAGMELKAAPDMSAMTLEVFENNEEVIVISEIDADWSQIYTTDDYTVGYVLNSAMIAKNKMVLREEVNATRRETLKTLGTAGVLYLAGGNVDVKTMPADEAETKISLPSETSCLLIKTMGDWRMISYGDNYTVGYVKTANTMTKDAYNELKAEQERKRQEEERKRQEQERIRQEQATKKQQSRVKASSNAVVEVPQEQPVQNIPSDSSKGQQIVNLASKYLGVRYVYGGSSPSGFDCSGLVQYVCRQLGISVNRSSRDQYKNGVYVAKSNLQPGDLVFFAKGKTISHVGIYAGNGQVIHSPRPGKVVCYVSLASMCSYSNYVGARRVY